MMRRILVASVALSVVTSARAQQVDQTARGLAAQALNAAKAALTPSVAASTYTAKANNLSDLANPAAALVNLGGLSAGNNLSDIANPATARANLGLGSVAVLNSGISGAAVCVLNTACTWGGAQAFGSGASVTGGLTADAVSQPSAASGNWSITANPSALVLVRNSTGIMAEFGTANILAQVPLHLNSATALPAGAFAPSTQSQLYQNAVWTNTGTVTGGVNANSIVDTFNGNFGAGAKNNALQMTCQIGSLFVGNMYCGYVSMLVNVQPTGNAGAEYHSWVMQTQVSAGITAGGVAGTPAGYAIGAKAGSGITGPNSYFLDNLPLEVASGNNDPTTQVNTAVGIIRGDGANSVADDSMLAFYSSASANFAPKVVIQIGSTLNATYAPCNNIQSGLTCTLFAGVGSGLQTITNGFDLTKFTPTGFFYSDGHLVSSGTGDIEANAANALLAAGTTGFFHFPHVANVPTGTPADTNGPACVWNTNSHVLDCYDGVSWYHFSGTATAL